MTSTDKSKRLKRDDEIDETDEPLIFDAVLCTVPLGILKVNQEVRISFYLLLFFRPIKSISHPHYQNGNKTQSNVLAMEI